ncbi:MAG: TIR domain-containing protein [Bacteroidetes bacterium]|nr:TIR domain-containing protein [Bacteroidota bacterium]
MNKFVIAPQFKRGSPIFFSQNSVVAYSGGNAVVFPIHVHSMKFAALRCWLRNPGDIKEKYLKIKEYLDSHKTSYLVDFDYIEEGIVINGDIYPVSYMKWVQGTRFSEFIDENIDNTHAIETLAIRFLSMVKELHRIKISHGDLSDANIIVVPNLPTFDLKLVDYDCLYVPLFEDLEYQYNLQGSPAYQHPKRYNYSNEKADYFSELVIYLSLLAYAEKPNLWHKGQEMRLLFNENDFLNPSTSAIFKFLESLSPRIKILGNVLKKFCEESNTNNLLPLEQIIQEYSIPTTNTESIPVVIQNFSKLSIFLCHSSNDKPQVRELYKLLKLHLFDPWFDEEKLIPGQDWQKEIPKAVQKADIVIVCLSRDSVNKKGYIHSEIAYALDEAKKQPEGTIFLIPLKLEECEVPESLRKWHWVNFFKDDGEKKLLKALQIKLEKNNN